MLRALDKASAPAEAEKAAHALIVSLRTRGISGYEILGGTAPADTANPGHPTEAWFKKAKEDWYRDHVNRGPDDPPPGVDPDAWRCAWEKRDPTAEEAARMDAREAWDDWLFSDDDTPPPQTRVVAALLKMALRRDRSRIASGTLCVSSVPHKHLRL